MSKFKVGDKVIVKPDSNMPSYIKNLVGKVYTVSEINPLVAGNDGGIYFQENTNHFWYFANRFEHAPVVSEFDPAAPIERQFTRDGRKVVSIFNSGLDVDYPLAVWLEGGDWGIGYTTQGKLYITGNKNRSYDLITRPELKPLEVSYTAVTFNPHQLHTDKPNQIYHWPNLTFEKLKEDYDSSNRFDDEVVVSILETTYNPNSKVYSYKFFKSVSEIVK